MKADRLRRVLLPLSVLMILALFSVSLGRFVAGKPSQLPARVATRFSGPKKPGVAAPAVRARRPLRDVEREREQPDFPAEAMAWRRLRMLDENGNIPPNALMNAKAQVDVMRARAGSNPPPAAGITTASWTWLGPGNIGGRVRAIVIDPVATSTWYAGSVGGGIWKTTNSGGTWTALNDFIANLAVSTMVMQPGTSGATAVLYTGTGEGFYNGDAIQGAGIFKSTDGGTSWTQLSATSPSTTSNFLYVNRVAMSAGAGATLLAGTRTGIFRSIDGGTSFANVTPTGANDGSGVFDVVFHPTDATKAVASGDYGKSWSSADGGATWGASTGLPSGRVEIAYAASSPTTVYASVDSSGGLVYKSTNGGATFALVTSGTPNLLASQGWYDNCIWVDPTNASTLIVGGVDLWKSTDGGVTFTQISKWQYGGTYGSNYGTTQSAHADHHAIVSYPTFDGSTITSVVFGNDGGVYSTTNVYTVGTSNNNQFGWVVQNHNFGVTQFYGAAGNATSGTIVAGAQDNGTLAYTTAGGPQNHQPVLGGDGGFDAADFQDSNYFYGEYVYLRIFRSSNGAGYNSGTYIYGVVGSGCKVAPYSITDACPNANANFIAPFVMDPNAAQTILAGGLQLWRTIDARTANTSTTGPSWASIKASTGSSISAIAIAPGNSNICWVGHNDGAVFYSTNCTNATPTWNQVNQNGLPARYISRLTIDPNNNSRVYASLGGYTSNNLWQTTNSGTNWASVSGSGGTALPSAPVYDLAIYPTNSSWLYAGTDVGIFTSQDMGATWTVPQSGPANVSVDQLFWMSANLVAATHGRGLFSATPSLASKRRAQVISN